MNPKILFSIVDSPTHPNLSALYRRLGLEEVRLGSQRKAITELKRQQPAFVVAEFIYAFSTYYQATNISNLDVFLHSLTKYAPEAKVIVVVKKDEGPLAEKLNAIHPLHAVLVHPVSETRMEAALLRRGGSPDSD